MVVTSYSIGISYDISNIYTGSLRFACFCSYDYKIVLNKILQETTQLSCANANIRCFYLRGCFLVYFGILTS